MSRRNSGQKPRSGGSGAHGGLGGEQLEGKHAVYELLRAKKRRVREIWLSEALAESSTVQAIESMATAQRIPLRRVARQRLDQMATSDAPQGVLAYAEPLRAASLDELIDQKQAFLVVLDGVTDPHNIGAIIRSAECAGATGIVLPKHRSGHITATVAKAAAGAIEYLPIALVPGIPAALQECKKFGVWSVGLDAEGKDSINAISVADQPIALVLGAEGSGLSELVRKRCDLLAHIAQFGNISSLNVSAAGAVALFAIAQQRQN